MEALVEEKWHLFRVWESGSGKEKVGMGEAIVKDLGTKMEDCNRAKRAAKSAIFRAKNTVSQKKFCEDLLDKVQRR